MPINFEDEHSSGPGQHIKAYFFTSTCSRSQAAWASSVLSGTRTFFALRCRRLRPPGSGFSACTFASRARRCASRAMAARAAGQRRRRSFTLDERYKPQRSFADFSSKPVAAFQRLDRRGVASARRRGAPAITRRASARRSRPSALDLPPHSLHSAHARTIFPEHQHAGDRVRDQTSRGTDSPARQGTRICQSHADQAVSASRTGGSAAARQSRPRERDLLQVEIENLETKIQSITELAINQR